MSLSYTTERFTAEILVVLYGAAISKVSHRKNKRQQNRNTN